MTLIVVSGNHESVDSLPGGATIVVSGGFDTINGEGGSDTVSVLAGGYDTIVEGVAGDQQFSLAETIGLSGYGNVVDSHVPTSVYYPYPAGPGGDEAFNISGGSGQTSISLGDGNSTISLGGMYNTIALGTGANTINAGSGYDSVLVTGTDSNVQYDDTIFLAGTHNTVLADDGTRYEGAGGFNIFGGNGQGNFTLQSGTLVTDGTYNMVMLKSGTTDITPGSGYDTITLSSDAEIGPPLPDTTIHLAGTHNTIVGPADSLVAMGGSGDGRFLLNQEAASVIYTMNGVFDQLPNDTYNVTTGGAFNTFSLLETNTNTVSAGSGYDYVTIGSPTVSTNFNPGDPPLLNIYETSSITFAGPDNFLDASTDVGGLTATGGSGYGTFDVGAANATITTGGSQNIFNLGGGADSVTTGSDHATVRLNGTDATLTLAGEYNMVFLSGGASGSISGVSPGLHVDVTGAIGIEVLNNYTQDTHAVIDLSTAATGYASAQQAVAALVSDGHGGALLPVGHGGIDFTGVAASSLHASAFVIQA